MSAKSMNAVNDARNGEIAKYAVAYEHPNYRMSDARRLSAVYELQTMPWRDSYLDVSCGRGEMLAAAVKMGFVWVQGTEVVEALLGHRMVDRRPIEVVPALAWELPFNDKSVDVISLFDVIEHLLPGDDERCCRELARVARRSVLLTANNRQSLHNGVELHVNRRSYDEWDGLFAKWFPAQPVWLNGRAAKFSEMWRIDL